MHSKRLIKITFLVLLVACNGGSNSPVTNAGSTTSSIPLSTETFLSMSQTESVFAPSLTPLQSTLTLSPDNWKSWPIIPVVTEHAREIYQRGRALHNNLLAFSVFGDCQSEPDVFMGVYDSDLTLVAQLPLELQETVANFNGSFNRLSPTALSGATAGALLWPEWHHGKFGCQIAETPVDCELRLHNPSFAIIHVGTHAEARNSDYLRRIIGNLIERGVVPILGTMADNRYPEVNHEFAILAIEYNIPLWNFWPAVNELPNRGLYTNPDEPNLGDIYMTDEALEKQRLTALQALDAVWRAVRGP